MGRNLGLDGKYQQAKTIAFEFHDVLEDSVELAKLDQYLGDADVNPFSVHVGALLEASELFVTTATIKSHKFTVEAKKADHTGLSLSVPDIQGAIRGDVTVSCQTNVTSRLTYEGQMPLVFGFQAVRLFYDEGRYTAFEPLPPKVGLRVSKMSKMMEPSGW